MFLNKCYISAKGNAMRNNGDTNLFGTGLENFPGFWRIFTPFLPKLEMLVN